MIQVLLNGTPFDCPAHTFRTLGEVVEYVKLNIDPDSLLINIGIDGRDVEENEWRTSLAVMGDVTIELETGTHQEFLGPRLEVASFYVEKIREGFSGVQQAYRNGSEETSHLQLGQAVQDLKAFVDWYENLLQLLPADRASERGTYHEQVRRISDVCEQIHQQQTFRAWWALADTIERRLDPELERLKGCCVKVAGA